MNQKNHRWIRHCSIHSCSGVARILGVSVMCKMPVLEISEVKNLCMCLKKTHLKNNLDRKVHCLQAALRTLGGDLLFLV